jgi:hypothetical protein
MIVQVLNKVRQPYFNFKIACRSATIILFKGTLDVK